MDSPVGPVPTLRSYFALMASELAPALVGACLYNHHRTRLGYTLQVIWGPNRANDPYGLYGYSLASTASCTSIHPQ